MFRDRRDAGVKLAEKLCARPFTNPLVLVIPRGGVEVGYEIAVKIGAELDVTVPRKIGAPHNPELAIGAVAEDGTLILNRELVKVLGVSEAEIERRVREQKDEIKRRTLLYRENRPPAASAGRDVIVVDDGIATGYTAMAALKSLERAGARRIILAVPVAPPDTLAAIERNQVEVVVLECPEQFHAVGNFYEDFAQTTDEEVIRLLRKARDKGGQNEKNYST